jgi:hypothetical protein
MTQPLRIKHSHFSFFAKVVSLNVVRPLKSYQNIHFHASTLTHPPQKFERPSFGMVAATALKLWLRGHLQYHNLLTEFHKNLPIGSEVGTGGQTHRQRGDLISLHFPLGMKVGYKSSRASVSSDIWCNNSIIATPNREQQAR